MGGLVNLVCTGPMSLKSCTQLCFNRKLPLASTEYGRNLQVRCGASMAANASVIKSGAAPTRAKEGVPRIAVA